MSDTRIRISLSEAVTDLKERTLSAIVGQFPRVIYLASTRDYITGHYYHDGLALRFREDLAEIALAYCHQEAFERLLDTSLEELTEEVESFLFSQSAQPSEVLDSWNKLQQYRILVPKECSRFAGEYFFSNFKIVLGVLEVRLGQKNREQCASRPQ